MKPNNNPTENTANDAVCDAAKDSVNDTANVTGNNTAIDKTKGIPSDTAKNTAKGAPSDAAKDTAKGAPSDTADNSSKILVIGSINMDYVLQTKRLPLKGETLPAKKFLRVFGGKGMNQTVAMKRLGASPIMVGCLGKDADGNALMEGLERESLSTSLICRSDHANTGMAFITVSDDGDNTIVVSPGSNHDLSVDWVMDAIKEHRDASMLVVQMEIPLEVVQFTIDKAYEYGIPVVLNPSPFKKLPAASLKKVHTLVVNEVEAEQIAATLVEKENDQTVQTPASLIRTLVKSGVPQILLTKGPEGVYYNTRSSDDQRFDPDLMKAGQSSGQPTEQSTGQTAKEIPVAHQPAKKVTVVDPTAAGDSFLGAYAAWRCQGYSLQEAVAYGILAGALAVTRAGAQPSIPTAEEMKEAGWKNSS